MTFPTVESYNTTQIDTLETSHPQNMPSGIVSGNLLLALFAKDGATDDLTIPGDWSTLLRRQIYPAGASSVMCILYKTAAGSDTLTITTTGGTDSNGQCFRISGHHTSSAPEQNYAEAQSSITNAPSLTPTWGAEDTLWFIMTPIDGSETFDLSVPANYSNDIRIQGASTSSATARRNLNATSDDPGSWTISAAQQWTAVTLAIRPASATTLEQEGYRWRADDGSESAASWLAAQETNITRAKNMNTRGRVIVNATGAPGSKQYQLEFRKASSNDFWEPVK